MKFYLLSLKWSQHKGKYVWWGPDNSGYTENLNDAGVYTEEQINSWSCITETRALIQYR